MSDSKQSQLGQLQLEREEINQRLEKLRSLREVTNQKLEELKNEKLEKQEMKSSFWVRFLELSLGVLVIPFIFLIFIAGFLVIPIMIVIGLFALPFIFVTPSKQLPEGMAVRTRYMFCPPVEDEHERQLERLIDALAQQEQELQQELEKLRLEELQSDKSPNIFASSEKLVHSNQNE